jgi:ribose/xylose/arabinose/galactoside ABC-type transport system permease subunit
MIPPDCAPRIHRLVAGLGPLIGLVVAWLLFAGLTGADFARWDNQQLMLLQTAVVGTAAVGATFIIISGGIDLSVGSSIALGTVVIAKLLEAGMPPLAAAAGGVVAAMLCGCVIGLLVTGGFLRGIELSPFIVTLGMWGALRGLAKGIADNQPVYPASGTWIHSLLSSSGASSLLPPGVWLLFAVALVGSFVLRSTRFGRHVFAIGSNERTAILCGVPVARTKRWIYVLGVGCAGLAALLQFSYLSMGDPTTADGYELKVIAAVVIGGASLSGGEGSIRGTLIGAFIMTIVDNGCTKLGLDNWIQDMVTGAIIVGAVAFDRLRHRRSRVTAGRRESAGP